MQKVVKKSPSGHHRTTLSGCIFATKACIDNRKKLVKQHYLLQMSPQYGELRPTSGWDRSGSLRHPSEFQRVSRLGSVTAWQSSSERQPNFVALNRGRHLCLAGRPSHWALAHILVPSVSVIVQRLLQSVSSWCSTCQKPSQTILPNHCYVCVIIFSRRCPQMKKWMRNVWSRNCLMIMSKILSTIM